MSLNGMICWATSMTASQGTQECGGQNQANEDAVPVTGCSVTLFGSGNVPLTVRVWTNLDSDAKDESFGIDNVIVQKLGPKTTSGGCVERGARFLKSLILVP